MRYPVWPFLVGGSKRFDYRTVVAPDFLCEAHKPALLSKTAGGDLTESDQAYLYQFTIDGRPFTVEDIQARSIILVYRVIKARSGHIGLEGNDVLRDKAGRLIYLVEGLVLLERQLSGPPEPDVAKEDLDDLLKPVQGYYQAFWNETGSGIPAAVPSRRQDRELGNGLLLKYIRTEGRSVNRKFFFPDKPDVWLEEGYTSLKDKDYQGALEDVEKAIQLDPQYAPAYIGRGKIFLERAASFPNIPLSSILDPFGDRERTSLYEKAVTDSDRAIQLTHEKDDGSEAYALDRSEAYALKGRALVELQRHKPAFEALFEALRLNRHNSTAHTGMQKLYKQSRIIETLSQ